MLVGKKTTAEKQGKGQEIWVATRDKLFQTILRGHILNNIQKRKD